MLTPDYTKQFQQDYKLSAKCGFDMSLIDALIGDLADERPFGERHRDHPQKGDYIGCRECHIQPDWLLAYRIAGDKIIFVRNGTHSDIFSN